MIWLQSDFCVSHVRRRRMLTSHTWMVDVTVYRRNNGWSCGALTATSIEESVWICRQSQEWYDCDVFQCKRLRWQFNCYDFLDTWHFLDHFLTLGLAVVGFFSILFESFMVTMLCSTAATLLWLEKDGMSTSHLLSISLSLMLLSIL